MKIVILITGRKGSGKTTAANMIKDIISLKLRVEKQQKTDDEIMDSPLIQVEHLTFAHCLREVSQKLTKLFYGIDIDFFDESIKEKEFSQYTFNNKPFSVRSVLQQVGTEVCRNTINSNIWIDVVKEKILKSNSDYFIVSDVRFINEYNVLKKTLSSEWSHEWIDFRIYNFKISRTEINTQYNYLHSSEKEIDKINADYFYENDGSLEDLRNFCEIMVENILK